MRFIVCARAREDGSVTLVSPESFANRREAVEAIIASTDVDTLLSADVFLVDLEAAAPVAIVPVADSGPARLRVSDADPDSLGLEDADDAVTPEPTLFSDHDVTAADTDPVVRLGSVEIDIESWTCEDCIYVLTCDKSGTLRPVDCGSFQWRA